ncbi:MAG: N-acetylmuramoyl-L-alanine amidase [Candidatus Hydrothermia bacterium]
MKSRYGGLLIVLCILTLTGFSYAQFKICLDPGHGGSDPGATGSYYTEKNANLDVALWAKEFMLRNPSISQVLMTRTSDVDVSLQDRVNYANSNYVDRFISVHQNSYNGTVQGTETYCYTYGSSASFNMRDSTHPYLVRAYGYPNRGAKTANFYVLVYTNMPAILGEGSFIDYSGTYNESWRFAYDWYAHRGRQGLAYAQGLSAHLNLPKPTFVLHTSYPETTITSGVTFQVRDSFYISSYDAPCDLVFEVKNYSTGSVIYTQRVNGLSSGYNIRTFNLSLPSSSSNYQVYFLSYIVPQGGNWGNKITHVSTSLLPTNVFSSSRDTSYIFYKNYPSEVYANTNFTVQDSFYIEPTQSPADLVFEIKSRASGTVLYSERVSNISSGYWIKTFGLQPTISLPDSGYDYQVYFLSILTPPGGGWSNRYTYASTYSNPTWVRTNVTPQNLYIAFTSYPEELYPDIRVYVSDTFFVQGVSLPLDHVLEIRDYSTDTVIYRGRTHISSEGGGTYTFGTSENISLPELGYTYYVYFLGYIVEPNGDFSSALVHCSSRALPTVVNTPIADRVDELVVIGGKGVFLRLQIEDSKTQGFYFKVYDATGRTLLHSSDELMANAREIMLSRELFPSSGVYFYELKIGGNRKTGKFIVY